jgi:hypothetical protein
VQERLTFRIAVAVVALLVLTGCSENAVKGGIIGGAGGAILGAATSGSHVGRNLGLGALIGGLIGALAGEVVTQRQAVVAATSPPPPPFPPPPPPPGAVVASPVASTPPASPPWSVVTAPAPPPAGPASGPAAPPDPTLGVITNGTLWEIHVYFDQPPGSPSPLVLKPGANVPAVLDIGQHRVVAQAFVETQLGRRTVGTFDQTLTVDPRSPGWTIHFFPANF